MAAVFVYCFYYRKAIVLLKAYQRYYGFDRYKLSVLHQITFAYFT